MAEIVSQTPPASTSSAPASPGAELGRGRLGLPDVIAQALGAVGPVYGALTFMPLMALGAAGAGAGGAIPLSILLSAVAVFGVAWTLSRFARRLRTAGSFYDYISRAFGDRAGAAFGSLSYITTILGIATAPLIFGGYLQDFLAGVCGINIAWWVLSLLFIAVVTVVLALGVSISTRAQLTLTLISMTTVTVFSVYVIVRGLGHGYASAGAPFSVGSAAGGWSGIFWGMLYGLFIFSGFETAANLAEETPHPKKAVPRAMLITVGLITLFHLVVAYATVIGFRLSGTTIVQYPIPLIELASRQRFGATWLVDLLTVMVLLDIFALTVAICVSSSRGLFTLARDGRLPSALTIVTRKRRTPVASLSVPVAWMVLVIVVVHLTHGLLSRAQAGSSALEPEYLPVFGWLGGLGGLAVAVIWGTVCLGALAWLTRRDSRPRLLAVTAALGLAAGAGVLYASLFGASTEMYVALAVMVLIPVASYAQSTIQKRRGTFNPSFARVANDD